MSLTSSMVMIVNGSVACDSAAGSEGASPLTGLPPHRCRVGDTGDCGGCEVIVLDGAVGTGSLYNSLSFRRNARLVFSRERTDPAPTYLGGSRAMAALPPQPSRRIAV